MAYTAREIEPSVARGYVKKYHYSRKVVANSKIHLGVFNESDELCGVLQYGPPMNGAKTSCKISESHGNMMELNRMVMRDEEPRNSESQAISACNKWLKNNTDIDYILSFSDGKEGNVGYIYQATNWIYIGYMLSNSFYMLDGHFMHSVSVWHKYKEKHHLRDTHKTNEILSMYFKNVSTVLCKQHVYVLPLRRGVKFLHKKTDYPKLDKEIRILQEKIISKDGKYMDVPEIKSYFSGCLVDIFGKKVKA